MVSVKHTHTQSKDILNDPRPIGAWYVGAVSKFNLYNTSIILRTGIKPEITKKTDNILMNGALPN